MSLQADSIVIWMMAETMSEDLGLSLPSISKGDSTAPWDSGAVAIDGKKKKKNGAVAKGKPALTKVIVSGVRIDASSQEKKISSSSVRDSSSSLVNNDVKSNEETTVVSSHACARIYIILGIIIAFGVLYIRKRIMSG
jgi:ribosomal protein L24